MKKTSKLLFSVLVGLLFVISLSGCSSLKQANQVVKQKTWYEQNGYFSLTFEKGICTMNAYGIGDEVFTAKYKIAHDYKGKVLNLKVYPENEEESSSSFSIKFGIDEDSGDVTRLLMGYEDKVVMIPDPVEPITFEEVYQPLLEEAVTQSEEKFHAGSMRTPADEMRLLTSVKSNEISSAYSYIKYMASMNGIQLDAEIPVPEPDPIPGRLYFKSDNFSIGELDYESQKHEPMPFTDEEKFKDYLFSTTWYVHGVYANPDAQMVNDGYLDVNLVMQSVSSIWLNFKPGELTMNLGNIITNEYKASEDFDTKLLNMEGSYGLMIPFPVEDVEYTTILGVTLPMKKGNFENVVYMDKEYDIKMLFFVDNNGLVIQSCGLYDDKTEEFIPISNYTVYTDAVGALWYPFEPMTFTDAEEFSSKLLANPWYLDKFAPAYLIDIYVPDLTIPEIMDTVEITQEFILENAVSDVVLFSPTGETTFNNVKYTTGFYIAMDADGKLAYRLALYDPQTETYKFTSHSWLYSSEPPEEPETEEAAIEE